MKIVHVSDLHARYKSPSCRPDEYYMPALFNKIDFVNSYAEEIDAIVLCTGDIFHSARPQGLLFFLDELGKKISNWICIPGNHDLSGNTIETIGTSAYGILSQIHKNMVTEYKRFNFTGMGVSAFPFGVDPITSEQYTTSPNIALMHTLTYPASVPFYSDGVTAISLIEKYPQFDIILTGDNHSSFFTEYDGHLVSNVGSLMRMSAKQYEFNPKIHVIDTDTMDYFQVEVPTAGKIQREELDRSKKLELARENFAEFINSLPKEGVMREFDFKELLRGKDIEYKIKEIVMEVLDELVE